jgi:signal transduction histidine kinase
MVPDSLARQILSSIGARAVAIKMGSSAACLPAPICPLPSTTISTCGRDGVVRDRRCFEIMLDSGETRPSAWSDRARQRTVHRSRDRRKAAATGDVPVSPQLLLLSLVMTSMTAGLDLLRLHSPFRAADAAADGKSRRFPRNPESASRSSPSQRGDEIGVAERELSDMQRDLVSMLHQKSRLAALGLAVSKINHDLRNLLASSQLLSDQLASVRTPGAALCAEADAIARTRHRFLPVDAVLWQGAGSAPIVA